MKLLEATSHFQNYLHPLLTFELLFVLDYLLIPFSYFFSLQNVKEKG